MIKPRLTLRPMRSEDVWQIVAIEEEVFPGDPWPESAFRRQVDNPMALFLILELENGSHSADTQEDPDPARVAAYAGSWMIVDEAHLMNIAVAPDLQGQGLGEYLLLHALRLLAAQGAATCTLEVRPSNKRAQSLYQQLGFAVEGRRRRYYVDNGEDALIMTTADLSTLQTQHRQQLEAARRRLGRLYDLVVSEDSSGGTNIDGQDAYG